MAMKQKIEYEIEFLSVWAVGSGQGGGSARDNVVLKDVGNRLPYIPGKTLKGLLRDAAIESGMDAAHETELFGHRKHGGADPMVPQDMKEGKLYFSSARLTAELIHKLERDKALVAGLYGTRSATRLDGNKQAVDHSLRKSEYCIPLTLQASIDLLEMPQDPNALEQLKNAMKLLRVIGENRYRGMGRCRLTLKK